MRGAGVERLLARYDIDNEDAMAYFEERLRQDRRAEGARQQGFTAGDEIEIGGVCFELRRRSSGRPRRGPQDGSDRARLGK